ncbi:MAG: hypothetical protein D6713_01440 [Deltaproteobacteria bacterium]|nr:MAG: hypothetical protein D6713_01440 [Deltaproteobacteria bacterium]
MRVEFYYHSEVEPAQNYYCNNQNALELLKKLEEKGVQVKVVDMKDFEGSIFRTYNAAVTGPTSSKRSVFGTKGALEEDFGRTVPALLVFEKEGDRYPTEVFPRMDRELGRLLGIEEAIQMLIDKA